MTDLEAPVVARCDRDDVESAPRVVEVHPLEIVLGQSHEPPALPPRYRGAGPIGPALLPALHFHENPDFAVAAHEIDLTLTELDVPRDDAQPGSLEEARRGFFRRAPEKVTWIAHAPDRKRAGGR